MQYNVPKKVFGFLDNCIWIDRRKFSLALVAMTCILSSTVNILTSSPKISDLTKRGIVYMYLL